MAEQTEMDALVEAMMEHICDELCRHPREAQDPEQLEDVCAGCGMSRYVRHILSTYNQLNDFDKSQCKHLLEELGRERLRYQWIQVTERLPKNEINVFVTYQTKKGKIGVNRAFFSCGKWYGSRTILQVIAWMPLPEPHPPDTL